MLILFFLGGGGVQLVDQVVCNLMKKEQSNFTKMYLFNV